MCYSLHLAVNVCINCSFLHWYNINTDASRNPKN